MRTWATIVLAIILFGPAAASAGERVTPLTLHRALAVEGPDNNQPSGLTIKDRTLYAVSDKHDDTIYKLVLAAETAKMVPHLRFNLPSPPRETVKCDLEGIACDREGNFYLVSESLFRILRVSTDGRQTAWVTPDLSPWGRAAGLFQKGNANLEGIAVLAPGKFVLCAERQPRGFVEVDTTTHPPDIRAYRSDATVFEFRPGRSPDFSGLYWDEGTLYVLERNAFLVCELVRKGQGFAEGRGWSYGHVVTRPALRFADMRYGKAEGLCMDRRYVYVILDNNGIARQAEPGDARPLLLLLNRPGAG
jgi:hypothetical protein